MAVGITTFAGGARRSFGGSGLQPPNMPHLKGLWFFGIDATESVKNYGSGPDATLVGTPTYPNAYEAACTSANHFDLGFKDDISCGLFAVGKQSAAQKGYISNFGATGRAAALLNTSGNDLSAYCDLDSGTSNTVTSDTNSAGWTQHDFIGSRIDNGRLRQTLFRPRIGEQKTQPFAVTTAREASAGSHNLRGGSSVGTYTGNATISVLGYFELPPRDDEMLFIFQWLRPIQVARGAGDLFF